MMAYATENHTMDSLGGLKAKISNEGITSTLIMVEKKSPPAMTAPRPRYISLPDPLVKIKGARAKRLVSILMYMGLMREIVASYTLS